MSSYPLGATVPMADIYRFKRADSFSGLVFLGDGHGAGPAEDHQVQQRVGAEPIRPVDGGAARFARGVQSADDLVLAVLVRQHLALVVGGDAAHVVVHGGQHRDGLPGHVHAGEDHGGLGDAGQTGRQLFWGQVVQLQVHVVLVFAATSANTTKR